jgi:metal-responsive CopG/Arc/MetJ family transcriptional regulator
MPAPESRHRQRPEAGMQMVNVSLPGQMVAKLEAMAVEQRLSRSAIVAQLLRAALELADPD